MYSKLEDHADEASVAPEAEPEAEEVARRASVERGRRASIDSGTSAFALSAKEALLRRHHSLTALAPPSPDGPDTPAPRCEMRNPSPTPDPSPNLKLSTTERPPTQGGKAAALARLVRFARAVRSVHLRPRRYRKTSCGLGEWWHERHPATDGNQSHRAVLLSPRAHLARPGGDRGSNSKLRQRTVALRS